MPLGKISPQASPLQALKLLLSCMKTGRVIIASLLCSLKLTHISASICNAPYPEGPFFFFFYHCTKSVATEYLYRALVPPCCDVAPCPTVAT